MSRRLPRGLLVAIEGIDGAGKTTQAEAVAARLQSVGFEVVRSKEPTSGPWGQRIREWASSGRLSPEAEFEAFTEDRREHVRALIAPALARGAVVILDRYYYSNAAYQVVAGLSSAGIIEQNEKFAPRPDLLVVLDVPVQAGLSRIRSRGDRPNHFEAPEQLERCASVFRSLTGEHVRVIDGMLPMEHVTAEICRELRMSLLFQELCSKRAYKAQCEPEYCSSYETCGYPATGPLQPLRVPSWVTTLADESLTPSERIDLARRLGKSFVG